jgi:hypothetical protein
MKMKTLVSICAVAVLVIGLQGCGIFDSESSEKEDLLAAEEIAADVPVEKDVPVEADGEVMDEIGECSEGESAGFVQIRIADNENNPTLTDCNTNPGADIDAVVIVKPDGTEIYATTVEEDADQAGGICPQNDKDDINTVLGVPDACVKDLGCGCGEYGYDQNPDCNCTDQYVGYYSLNGSAIIMGFDDGVELLCGDMIRVYEMYNPDVDGSEEAYKIFYGDEMGNWSTASDIATGFGEIEVAWSW